MKPVFCAAGFLVPAKFSVGISTRFITVVTTLRSTFVALGVFHRLTLLSKRGVKLSIGERLHGSGDLAKLIQSYTLPEMIRKAVHEFERGAQLDFGAIRLNRKNGVKYQNWWFWHELRWESLSKYGASDSHVNLSADIKLLGANIRSEEVANVYVLEERLDRVKNKDTERWDLDSRLGVPRRSIAGTFCRRRRRR